jgi:phage tail sheath protein FI
VKPSLLRNKISTYYLFCSTQLPELNAFTGTTPATSYQVLIGLGETMTEEDVLDGYMRLSIMIAPLRPAEFIVLTFSQMVGQ